MVPAPQVSVRPYPWPTGQQKHTFMNRWVAADNGAPPDNNTRKRPPNNDRTFRKTNLERERTITHVQKWFCVLLDIRYTCHTSVCCIPQRAAPSYSYKLTEREFSEKHSSDPPSASRSYRCGPWSPAQSTYTNIWSILADAKSSHEVLCNRNKNLANLIAFYAFFSHAPILWNSLSIEIRQFTSIF